jgi:hypothetical protein
LRRRVPRETSSFERTVYKRIYNADMKKIVVKKEDVMDITNRVWNLSN